MKYDDVRETDVWVKWDRQTRYIKYLEWDTKHEFQNQIELWIDHRGELEISRNDDYGTRLRLDTLTEVLKKLND